AALRLLLILDMKRGGTGPLELANRPRDVERVAPSGIAVDEKRQRRRARDPAGVLDDIRERRHAEIRQTEGRVRDAGAGKIDRLESRPLREKRAIRVDRTGNDQRRASLHRSAKAFPRRARRRLARARHACASVQNDMNSSTGIASSAPRSSRSASIRPERAESKRERRFRA